MSFYQFRIENLDSDTYIVYIEKTANSMFEFEENAKKNCSSIRYKFLIQILNQTDQKTTSY